MPNRALRRKAEVRVAALPLRITHPLKAGEIAWGVMVMQVSSQSCLEAGRGRVTNPSPTWAAKGVQGQPQLKW